MGKPSKNKNSSSLKSGRPPIITSSQPSQGPVQAQSKSINARRKSSRATRTLINLHHQLQKSRAAAVSSDNENLVREIDSQILQLGGLEAYQAASLTGQDRDRGGDSSEKLVEWLREYGLIVTKASDKPARGLRVLEIGALSSKNAISAAIGKGIETVRRIDLHSQEPGCIEEIDFMELQVPSSDTEKFDVVSLSLVLNYVPDILQRGEMLRRTTRLLRRAEEDQDTRAGDKGRLPCLFVVLPLPCLSNSRYMTHDHFVCILASLGYILIEHHDSQKLSYMLFQWTNTALSTAEKVLEFKKIEINPGKSRNNFAIVLQSAAS